MRVKWSEQRWVKHSTKRAPFLLLVLVLCSLVSGCATTGDVSEEPGEVVVEELTYPYPEWFVEGAGGQFENGIVSGLSRAVGIEAAWTIDNATRQAAANLKYRLDEELERARLEAEEENGAVSGSEFIRNLRNAVGSLEPADYPVRSDTYEEDGVIYAVVRIDVSAEEALDAIEQHLGNHQQAWEAVLGRL